MWQAIRRFAATRIKLGHAGVSQPTSAQVEFQRAHARARPCTWRSTPRRRARRSRAHGLKRPLHRIAQLGRQSQRVPATGRPGAAAGSGRVRCAGGDARSRRRWPTLGCRVRHHGRPFHAGSRTARRVIPAAAAHAAAGAPMNNRTAVHRFIGTRGGRRRRTAQLHLECQPAGQRDDGATPRLHTAVRSAQTGADRRGAQGRHRRVGFAR